jgi:hypothetical protein
MSTNTTISAGRIVSFRGPTGRYLVDRLFNVEGTTANGITDESVGCVVNYLSQWNNDYSRYDEATWPADAITFSVADGRFLLTADLANGFVGLSRVVHSEESADGTAPDNLSAFEQDRYARLLREHGSSPSALVNGSIGATRIPAGPASCVTCRQLVPVDFDYCG